jgi:hypothetical protein
LYNHLFYSHLPAAAIDDVIDDRNYWKIIDHPNYSPRLIEHVVGLEEDWLRTSFFATFMDALENPAQLWRKIFESLPDGSRTLLLSLLTLNRDVAMSILESVSRRAENSSTLDTVSFERTLRGLEGTFINIRRPPSFNASVSDAERIVSFSNPSIIDFLWAWLRDRPGTLARMFSRSSMFAQRMRILNSPLALSAGKDAFLRSMGLSAEYVSRSLLEYLEESPDADSRKITLRIPEEDLRRYGDTPDLRLCRCLEYMHGVTLGSASKVVLVSAVLERSQQWLNAHSRKEHVLELLLQCEKMSLLKAEKRNELIVNAKQFFLREVSDLYDADALGDFFQLFRGEFSEEEESDCTELVMRVLGELENELDAAEKELCGNLVFDALKFGAD